MKNILKLATILLCLTPLSLLANNNDIKEIKSPEVRGSMDATYNLGVAYFYGTGVTQNYEQAFKYFKLASDNGHIDAMYNLGELYYFGLGTEKNYKESAKLTKTLADKNDNDALIHLAMFYKKGINYPKGHIKLSSAT